MTDGVSTWNHRVMRFDEDGETWFAIHEVHYDNGRPVMYTERPAVVFWAAEEGMESAVTTIERFRKALDLPVLTPADFTTTKGDV